MRIKHAGQRAAPTNPKHDAGTYHAQLAKLAVCNCGGQRQTVLPYPVNVSTKRRRGQAAPAAV